MRVKIDYGDRRSISVVESLKPYTRSKKGGRPPIKMIGRTFGMWTVIKLLGQRPDKHLVWLCKCECGGHYPKNGCDLRDTTTGGCKKCRHKRMLKLAESKMWQRLEHGATCRGYRFSIDRQATFCLLQQQKFKCALTGLPIGIALGARAFGRGESTASLDRINNKLGYTPGNVWWVHKEINRMKGTLTVEEFIEYCRRVSRRNRCSGQ